VLIVLIVLRTSVGPKTDEVTGHLKKMNNEEHQTFTLRQMLSG